MSEKNVTYITNSIVGAVVTGDGGQAHGVVDQRRAEDAAGSMRRALEQVARRAESVNLSAWHGQWNEFMNVRFDLARIADLRPKLPRWLAAAPLVSEQLDQVEEVAQELNTHLESARAGGFHGPSFIADVCRYAVRLMRAAQLVVQQIDLSAKQTSQGG